MMTKAEATRLRDVVDEALDAAGKLGNDERYLMGAINWGDLSCCDVEERKSVLHGSTMIAVTIEEASPDAHGLIAFVGKYLDAHGYPNVYVVTEW